MLKIKNLTEAVIYTDGASRGNPGPASVGVVLFSGSGKKISEVSKYIGEATNNIAEYLAVIYGLQEACLYKAGKVLIKTDSQLVARQLKGEYKVRDVKMRLFFDIAKDLFRFFDKIEIKEIPREENSLADFLANKALDDKVLL
jgi:ribonuclease HI